MRREKVLRFRPPSAQNARIDSPHARILDHTRSIQLGRYIVPLAMLAIAFMLIAAALWLACRAH